MLELCDFIQLKAMVFAQTGSGVVRRRRGRVPRRVLRRVPACMGSIRGGFQANLKRVSGKRGAVPTSEGYMGGGSEARKCAMLLGISPELMSYLDSN